MEAILGIDLETWNRSVRELLVESDSDERLTESEEDAVLPYFVLRTLCNGMFHWSLADLALTIHYGEDAVLGPLLANYARLLFTLASGVVIDWESESTYSGMASLRHVAD